MELWHDLLRDVHTNEAIAGAFYIVVALVLGMPLRFVARVLEALPAAWLTKETTTAVVTFGAWFVCWLAIRYEPMFNGTALFGTVTAVVVGPLLKKLMDHVDYTADKTTAAVDKSGVFKGKGGKDA